MENIDYSILITRIIIINLGKDKKDLIEWVYAQKKKLQQFEIVTTANNAEILEGLVGKEIQILSWGAGGEFAALNKLVQDGGANHLLCFGTDNPRVHQSSALSKILKMAIDYNLPLAFNTAGADAIINSLTKAFPQRHLHTNPEEVSAAGCEASCWTFKPLSAVI